MTKADIGVYGLGTMGSALALNLADKGFTVAVSNRETDWIAPFVQSAGTLAGRLRPADTLVQFVAALRPPRAILFMIPSGAPMDAMLTGIAPLLAPGDTVIDGGNADFNDTGRRAGEMAAEGLHFIGMGVSGGADGARRGPALMVGGPAAGWARIAPMAEVIAARFRGDPCVAYLGPGGAGHFVKTVHNGIEYADMQMIAEIYGLLRDGAGWEAPRIGALFAAWNDGPLAAFLTEITATALGARDPATGAALVDVIRDGAGQKGTGRWTVIEALKLGQSASAIEAAVGARAWSSERAARAEGQARLRAGAPDAAIPGPPALAEALLAGRILTLGQGFRVLAGASEAFGWTLDLARIAEIWRAGCIIRSALLDDVAAAFHAGPPQGHLIFAPALRDRLGGAVGGLRQVVSAAALAGLPVPALAAALGWHDSMARARGTANLIQAQRDLFGAHGFERTDRPGRFHGDWPGRDGGGGRGA